jgi:hypothetical protein
MDKKEFEKLVNESEYQVFVMCCPAHFPFIFAIHPWFVCNEKGKISRWEFLFKKNQNKDWGYLHLNNDEYHKGIEIFPFLLKIKWPSRLLIKIGGRQAKEMIDIIRKSKQNYPYLKNYSLLGSNSNTYAQWILSHSKNIKKILPWNAFGKNYTSK